MHKILTSILTLLLLSQFCTAQKVVKKEYQSGLKEGGDGISKFVFYVTYPKSYEAIKAKKGWQPTILLMNHLPLSMLDRVEAIAHRKDKFYPYYYELSEKYGLPIITQNCPRYHGGFYSRDGNSWELPKSLVGRLQQNFLKIDTRWQECLEDFCQEQGLESRGFLGVGLSTGAQFLSRVAMIHPELFHSVESIMPGSNPTPSSAAKQIHWLQVSGGRDGGYDNCNRFYEKAKKLGYHRIFYIAPHSLGHGSAMRSNYLDSFRAAYYEFILSNKEKPANKKIFIGDYLNNVVTHRSRADWIPENQRVYFPDLTMARSWGQLLKD